MGTGRPTAPPNRQPLGHAHQPEVFRAEAQAPGQEIRERAVAPAVVLSQEKRPSTVSALLPREPGSSHSRQGGAVAAQSRRFSRPMIVIIRAVTKPLGDGFGADEQVGKEIQRSEASSRSQDLYRLQEVVLVHTVGMQTGDATASIEDLKNRARHQNGL